jgi:hypothetical protein
MAEAAEQSAVRPKPAMANEAQSTLEEIESNCATQNQHRLTLRAPAPDFYPRTALPKPPPLPDPLGKCPPLTAANDRTAENTGKVTSK